MRNSVVFVAALVIGCAVGAGGTWLSVRPATKMMAEWLRLSSKSPGNIEVSSSSDQTHVEHLVLRLSKMPTGTSWTLVFTGRNVAATKEDVLTRLGRLAQVDRSLAVFIRADPDVNVRELQDCVQEITKRGLHEFCIQDGIWATTDIKAAGVP